MTHPDKTLVVETLLEAGRRAANNSASDHPDDIAVAMVSAIETGAEVIQILHENGNLTTGGKV